MRGWALLSVSVFGLVLLLSSCSGLKKSTTTSSSPADSSRRDTGKVSTVATIDSVTNSISNTVSNTVNKISDFFGGLIPGGTKDSVIRVSPRRVDNPAANPSRLPNSGGFISTPLKRQITFDSLGHATIHDVVGGSDVRQSQTVSLTDFINAQRDIQLQSSLREAAQKHVASSTGTTTAAGTTEPGKGNGVLSDYGSISIPIPPSIVPTIFGKPSINLRVNGDVAIHLAYRDNQFLATTGSFLSGSETGLDFKQEVNMNISGSVGDKIKINTDFGSLRQFSFDNIFKLSYQGFPDEIIQSIEAGNVSLNTPSKYIGIQSALFGFKSVMRFGPLYFTALAAQKKGEHQSKSFGGGPGSSSGSDYTIQPASYRRNSYFFDTTYAPIYEQYYFNVPNSGTGDVISRGSVEVWRSSTLQSSHRVIAHAWYGIPSVALNGLYSPPFHGSGGTGDYEGGPVEHLDTNQFSYNPATGVLTLTQEPSDNDFIAVSYVTAGGEQFGERSQTIHDTDIVLKLIKPRKLYVNPSYGAWKNLLKNTYYVGATNIDQNTFSAKISYTFPTGESYEFVRGAGSTSEKAISVMGLDRFQNTNPGIRQPDGAFDIFPDPSPILDRRNGTLIFPYLEPFGNRILAFHREQLRKNPKYRPDSTFYFPELYTTSLDNLQRNTITKNTKIFITAKYSGGTSSTISLNAFNIVEGSVRVSAGGRQLVEGVDYRVDINGGSLTLLKPDLATAGQIQVDYDVHDIFTTSTKNLLGFRGEVPILDHGLIGLSLLNYSLHMPSIKTRQGEEPISNWILGADASYKLNLPWLTSAMNALPIFNLKDKSELNIKLDGAISLPNPNTQVSPMDVDHKASIAYLDDFEGGKTEFPLMMSYGRWAYASQPQGVPSYEARGFYNITDSIYWENPINRRKSKIWWFENSRRDVLITDLEPNKSLSSPSQTAQVLDVVFDPENRKGIYNANPDNSETPDNTWGGLMQWNQGLNIQTTNTDAIQFWMNIGTDPKSNPTDPSVVPNGVLHFDMGKISEDIIPDGKLEAEDINGNGRYDDGEDIGLDRMTTDSEKIFFKKLGINIANPDDPSNDDYHYDNLSSPPSSDYSAIDGSENNQHDFSYGLHPETEDLNVNSTLDNVNSYYEYDIPINPTNNPYVVGQGKNGWVQLRIPITDFKRIIGNADSSFSNIDFFRLWFSGYSKVVHLRFSDIGLVGSQWAKGKEGLNPLNPTGDNSLEINYVNIEDNSNPPSSYVGPPGAQRDRLAGGAVVTLGNEQSIDLKLKCVPVGTKREATHIFQSPNDLFNYRSMAIWVHGDATMPKIITDTTNKVWVYFRFGSDPQNYYEYRMPLVQDWHNIHVDFSTLSALKATKVNYFTLVSAPVGDENFGSMYRVIGSPSITNAPYFTIGVENESADPCLTTDVWWDELRLLQANDKVDYAVNASVQAKLAEFGTLSAAILNEGPDFHRVDERFNATRSRNYAWNLTGEFQIQKILPAWLERGTVFPLTLSHSETILTPKYVPNTDIEVNAAVQKIQDATQAGKLSQELGTRLADSIRLTNETLNVRNSIAATGVHFTVPGTFFLLPAFVNRLTYGFGYGEEFTRSPQYLYNRTWSWTGSILYDINQIPTLSLPLLSWIPPETFDIGRYSGYKLNFLPQRFNMGISATRGRMHSLYRTSTLVFPPGSTPEEVQDILSSNVPYINRVFTANRGFGFTWKLSENGLLSPQVDYKLDVSSNLAGLETYSVPNRLDTDAFGNPIYTYDSAYIYQRPFKAIMSDVFFKNGAIARLGNDFLASQHIRITTTPRLPWLLWIDKFIRPIFLYNVDYRWTDAQNGQQNAKTGSWNNTITTGFELNLRELGVNIFGNDAQAPGGNARRGRGESQSNRFEEGRRASALASPDAMPGEPDRFADPNNPRPNVRRVGNASMPHDMAHPPPPENQVITPPPPQQVTPIDSTKAHSPGVGTRGIVDDLSVNDTLLIPKAPPISDEQPEEGGITAKDIVKALIQKPFFDWNGTKFNFIQTNSSLNGALQGTGSGITNFVARGIFSPEDDGNGPSRAYQMGLITDPSGRLLIKFVPTFPFISFGVRHGLRAANPFGTGSSTIVTDVFTQKNSFDLQTSRPLWEGATINFNWKTEFTYDERDQLQILPDGHINPLTTTKIGDVSRSFLSIPPIGFLNITQSGIENVGKKWLEKTAALTVPALTNADRDALPAEVKNRLQVESFREGFETLPLFSSWLREYLPRLNYSFTWNGIEKLLSTKIADRVSFRTAYNGTYKRTFKLNPGDTQALTTLQTITYAFRPLIALDFGWDKIGGGKLTASVNYDTQSDWAADYNFNRITKRLATTFGITANFSKEGLTIPFLKLNLKNNFGATFIYSQTVANDLYYTFNDISTNPNGTSNGGITKTTLEPRFSYDINQQLTIEGFYRYERTTPASSGVLVPPTRLINVGIDIRLKVF
ncbi:MAG: cell surface protein SprA [bacterium]